ncbi:polysaccharide pyruvyl transferase family protein [Brackiella oedipodis]|uniref:polysaccharide pyruvyl transferase family protein n=1 Tax=Brackiella oedipodis TaxID=124225 RepID=UPI000684AC4B|nr:polysaccharide pyruvyl transferase family protein [Brackiella oedipodis]
MKIYLISPAGYPNFGDELILQNWVSYLRRHLPDAEIWVDVPFVGNVLAYLSQYKVTVTNTLWRLVHERCNEDIAGSFAYVDRSIKQLGSPHLDISLLTLRDIDVVHIVGGGYINSKWVSNMSLLQCAKAIKELNHCKAYITGTGFLPIYNPADVALLKEVLTHFDFVESRDEPSAQLLAVEHGSDDAFLALDTITEETHRRDQDVPEIMVCLQRDQTEEITFFSLLSALTCRLKSLVEAGHSIGYIEAIPGQDRLAYELLSQHIEHIKFYPASDSIMAGLPIKPDQQWYSTRFHHHLVAAAAGCRGVALSISNDYYDIKHQLVIDNGSGWSLWSNRDALELPQPTCSDNVHSRFMTLCKEKQALALRLYGVTPTDTQNTETPQPEEVEAPVISPESTLDCAAPAEAETKRASSPEAEGSAPSETD